MSTAPSGRARQRRSVLTEQRILAAASELFVADGYAATTMAAVASRAGVAVQSLYLRFGGKLQVLRAALDAAIVGDTAPVPLLERDWFARLGELGDGPGAVRLFVGEIEALMIRTYPSTRSSCGRVTRRASCSLRTRRSGTRACA